MSAGVARRLGVERRFVRRSRARRKGVVSGDWLRASLPTARRPPNRMWIYRKLAPPYHTPPTPKHRRLDDDHPLYSLGVLTPPIWTLLNLLSGLNILVVLSL